MPRHGHGHIPPIPPVPPIPPIDPEDCGERIHIRNFRDFVRMATHGHGWQGRWGPFQFDFGDEGGNWGGRRGRGRRRVFGSGELRLVLLKLIADEPRHGYDLIRAIEELTGGEYAPSPGVVYPTLTLLQDMGFIVEAPDADGPRKSFAATDDGRAHLDENEDEVEELFERLSGMAPDPRHAAGSAIGRAVKNLMTALKHRVGRDGFDEDLLHEIAAILDEAAQRIDRVKPAKSSGD